MEAEVYIPRQAAVFIAFVVSAHGLFWPVPREIRPFPIAENTDHGVVGLPLLMGYHRFIINAEKSTEQPFYHPRNPRPKYFSGAQSGGKNYGGSTRRSDATRGQLSGNKSGVSALQPTSHHGPTDEPDKTSHPPVGHPDETFQEQGSHLQIAGHEPTDEPSETSQRLVGHPDETPKQPVSHSQVTGHGQTYKPDKTSHPPVGHPDETPQQPVSHSQVTGHGATDEPDKTPHRPVGHPDETLQQPASHSQVTGHGQTDKPHKTSHPPVGHPDEKLQQPASHSQTAGYGQTDKAKNQTAEMSQLTPDNPDNSSSPASHHPDSTPLTISAYPADVSSSMPGHRFYGSSPVTGHQNNTSHPSPVHPNNTSYPASEDPDNTPERSDNKSYPAPDHPNNTSYPASEDPDNTSERSDNTSYPAPDHPSNTSYPAAEHPDNTSFPAAESSDNRSYPAADRPDSTSFPAPGRSDNRSFPASKRPDMSYPASKHPDNTSKNRREKATFSREKQIDLSKYTNHQHLNIDSISRNQYSGRSTVDSNDTSIEQSLKRTKERTGKAFPTDIGNQVIQPFHTEEKTSTPRPLEKLGDATNLKEDSPDVIVIYANDNLIHLLIKVFIYGTGSDPYSQGNTDNSGGDNTDSTQDSLGNTDNSAGNNTDSTQDSLGNTDNSGGDNTDSAQDSLGNTDNSGGDNTDSTQDSLGNTDNSGGDNTDATQDSLGNTDNSGGDNTDSTQDSQGNTDNSGEYIPYSSDVTVVYINETEVHFLLKVYINGIGIISQLPSFQSGTYHSKSKRGDAAKDITGSTEPFLVNTNKSKKEYMDSTRGPLGNTDKSGKYNIESAHDSLVSARRSGENQEEMSYILIEVYLSNRRVTSEDSSDTDNSGENNTGSTQDFLDNEDQAWIIENGTVAYLLLHVYIDGIGITSQDSLDKVDKSARGKRQDFLRNTDTAGEDNTDATQDSLDDTDNLGEGNTDPTQGFLESMSGSKKQYSFDKRSWDNRGNSDGSTDRKSSEESSEIPVIDVRIYVQTLHGNQLQNSKEDLSNNSQSNKELHNRKTYTVKFIENNGSTKYLLISVDMDEVLQMSRKQHSQAEFTQFDHTDKSEPQGGTSLHSNGSPVFSQEDFGETRLVDVTVDVQRLGGNQRYYSEEDFNNWFEHSTSDETLVKQALPHMIKLPTKVFKVTLPKQTHNDPSAELEINLQKSPMSSNGQPDELSVVSSIHTTEENGDVDRVSPDQQTEPKTGLLDDTGEESQLRTIHADQMSLKDFEMQDKRALYLMKQSQESPHKQKLPQSANVSDQTIQESNKQYRTKHSPQKVHVDIVLRSLQDYTSDLGEENTSLEEELILTSHPSAQQKPLSYYVDNAHSLTEATKTEGAASDRLSPERVKRSLHLSAEPRDLSPSVTIGIDVHTLPESGKHYSVDGLDKEARYSQPVDAVHPMVYTVKLTKESLNNKADDSSKGLLASLQKTFVREPGQQDEFSMMNATEADQSYKITNVSSERTAEQQTGLPNHTWTNPSGRKKNASEQLAEQQVSGTRKLVLHFIQQVIESADQVLERPLDSTDVPNEEFSEKSDKSQHLLLKVYVDGVPQSIPESLSNLLEAATNSEEEPNQMLHPTASDKKDGTMEESASTEVSAAEKDKETVPQSAKHNPPAPQSAEHNPPAPQSAQHNPPSSRIDLKFYTHELPPLTSGKEGASPLKNLSEMRQSTSQEDVVHSKSLKESIKHTFKRQQNSRKHPTGAPQYFSMDVYLDGTLLTAFHDYELPQYVDANPTAFVKSSANSQENTDESSRHFSAQQDHPLGQIVKISDKSGSASSGPSLSAETQSDSTKRALKEPLELPNPTFEHLFDHLGHPKKSHPEEFRNFLAQLSLDRESNVSRNQDKVTQDPVPFSPSTTTPRKSHEKSTKWYTEEFLKSTRQQLNDHTETSKYKVADFPTYSSVFSLQSPVRPPHSVVNVARPNFELAKTQGSANQPPIETVNIFVTLRAENGDKECTTCILKNKEQTHHQPSQCSCTCNTIPRHIQVTGQNCAWRVVVKSVAGVGDGPYADLTTPNSINMADGNAQLMSSPLPYANSDISSSWENRNIYQVKIEVYSGDSRKACYVFNGENSTAISWMSRDRLLCSSYQVPDPGKLDLLDVAGEAPFRFSVHETTGGCDGTCGFLSTVEPGNDCPSLALGHVRPFFLYSTQGSSCARWHIADEYGIGDLFVVSVLECDTKT